MKSTILASAALCVCPPLIATTATMSVPKVKHAVHRATAPARPHAAKLKPHAVDPCAELKKAAYPAGEDAIAGALGERRGAPFIDLADIGSDSGKSGPDDVTILPQTPVNYPLGPGPVIDVVKPPTPPVNPPAVPEPSTWAMMLGGFWAIGASIRNRASAARRKSSKTSRRSTGSRRSRASRGWLVAAAELGGTAKVLVDQSAAVAASQPSTAAAHSLGVALMKKAAVCVCSGAIMATAVTTVPPLKRAVYAATMPAHSPMSADCVAE